jgi:hypothetical protein
VTSFDQFVKYGQTKRKKLQLKKMWITIFKVVIEKQFTIMKGEGQCHIKIYWWKFDMNDWYTRLYKIPYQFYIN